MSAIILICAHGISRGLIVDVQAAPLCRFGPKRGTLGHSLTLCLVYFAPFEIISNYFLLIAN